MANQVFILPTPKPGDTRERNAFGVLKGFGRAAADYYSHQNNQKVEAMYRIYQFENLDGKFIIISENDLDKVVHDWGKPDTILEIAEDASSLPCDIALCY